MSSCRIERLIKFSHKNIYVCVFSQSSGLSNSTISLTQHPWILSCQVGRSAATCLRGQRLSGSKIQCTPRLSRIILTVPSIARNVVAVFHYYLLGFSFDILHQLRLFEDERHNENARNSVSARNLYQTGEYFERQEHEDNFQHCRMTSWTRIALHWCKWPFITLKYSAKFLKDWTPIRAE